MRTLIVSYLGLHADLSISKHTMGTEDQNISRRSFCNFLLCDTEHQLLFHDARYLPPLDRYALRGVLLHFSAIDDSKSYLVYCVRVGDSDSTLRDVK